MFLIMGELRRLGKSIALNNSQFVEAIWYITINTGSFQLANKPFMKTKALLLSFVLLYPLPIFADVAGFSFAGLMFGDYYYVAANHRQSIEDENGFWFRRIYFTTDKGLSESFDTRLRLEFNSPGDFVSNARLEPFVKDAYVRWKKDQYQILFGIIPSVTLDVIEPFWEYRSLEKTPLDLYRMGFSREFGVAVRGGSDQVKFHVAFGNGEGERGETNEGKAVMGSILIQVTDSLFTEFYADYNAMPEDVDRSTLQAFLGWQKNGAKIGIQYAHQEIDGIPGTDNLDVLSLFSIYRLNSRWAVVGRYDRMFDPNHAGEEIPYIPFAANAKSNFFLAALDFTVIENLFVQPNVEIVSYSDALSGDTPDTDVIPRITVFFKF